MNVDGVEPSTSELDEELRGALIARCHLNSEQVYSIDVEMLSLECSFCEAAIKLGLATEDDVKEAVDWARQIISSRDANRLEFAILRHMSSQALVPRGGGWGRPSARLMEALDPAGGRAEKMRALRTELLLLRSNVGQAIAIAVVSPTAGEGRSALAAELAVAFSRLGRRTLLVDADFRRPVQHNLFSCDQSTGLAQAISLGEMVLPVEIENLPFLSVVTVGTPPPDPLELISSSRFRQLMQSWRSDYAFVIIDTPPVGQFADALAIATLAGQALVVGRLHATELSEMKDMLRRLASAGATVLGAVLNEF